MGLMDELKKIIHPYDDEDYDYEDDFEEPAKESRSLFDDRKEERREERREDRRSEDRHNKVVNIHATTQLKVVLVKPERFENASEIADHLKEKRTVVLNLESTNKDVARALSTSCPAWPTPARARSRRSPPTPTSSPPIPWTSWVISSTSWKTTACICKL